jgi:hypothetical protein
MYDCTGPHDLILTAINIVAKDLFAATLTGAPVAVMCNSSTVRTAFGM